MPIVLPYPEEGNEVRDAYHHYSQNQREAEGRLKDRHYEYNEVLNILAVAEFSQEKRQGEVHHKGEPGEPHDRRRF